MKRDDARPIRFGVKIVRKTCAHRNTVAEIHEAWSLVVGPAFDSHCTPVSENDGVLDVECDSGVWLHEATYQAEEWRRRVNELPSAPSIKEIHIKPADVVRL